MPNTMTTASANRAFLPEQVHTLVVEPVGAESVALQAATVVHTDDRVNAYRVPIVTGDPSAAWVAEGEEIDATKASLDEVASTFSKIAGLSIISRELADDSSPEAANLVGRGLARDVARKLDAAFFGTRGSSTVQPAGLDDLEGATAVDAGTTWANTDPFAEAIYNAEAVGARLSAFVANPADALSIAKVKKATGSNEPLLGNDPTQPTRRLLAGVPLLISPGVTAGTVWGVPKDRAIVALRDDVRLEVDRSAYFSSDRVAVKVTMRAAILFPHAAAVQKITLGAGQ